MAYEPKTWVTGEVITAPDLNHMENAIGALYITATRNSQNVVTLSASYNDIVGAISSGKTVICVETAGSPAGEITFYSRLVMTVAGESYMASFNGANLTSDAMTTTTYTASDADSPLISSNGSE